MALSPSKRMDLKSFYSGVVRLLKWRDGKTRVMGSFSKPSRNIWYTRLKGRELRVMLAGGSVMVEGGDASIKIG